MSNFQDASNMQEILKLRKLLHKNGDKVLSALSKLSLSTTLLYNLNEAFSLIVDEPADLESSFQVCNSSKIAIFHDLKFLHDFVQKTVGLKLTYCPTDSKIPVDITKFRHLKYLELKKINIESIRGLQGVRGQLERITCAGRRGICTVSQLLGNYETAACGGDACFGFVWGSLKHLALPHNSLEQLDTSLELAPCLEIIDLSHNLIKSADELSFLPNLKYVNLGYNKLETIPTFNKAAVHTLQVLVLKNNYIENLSGLQNMECMTELDLSYNCLMVHTNLWPLEKMTTLLWVSLEGNPLSYHPKHRQLSVKYLHPYISNSKFVLDHIPLSKSEKQIIAENRPFTIRSEQSTSNEFLASVSNSLNCSSLSTSITASTVTEFVIEQPTDLTNMEKSLSKHKKRSNVKEAVIAEDCQKKDDSIVESNTCPSYLETSKDHLVTKKQILEIRKKYGEDNWLSSQGGSFVQDIMGLQPSSYSSLSSTDAIRHLDDLNTILNGLEPAIQLNREAEIEKQEGSQFSTVKDNDTHNETEKQTEQLNMDQDELENVLTTDTTNALTDISETPYDPDNESGDFYCVQKKKNDNELEGVFLAITSDDIKEIDSCTGRVKYSWSISSVLSCVLGRSEPVTVDIIFDTTREHRQNRRYYVEIDDAKKIVATVSEKMQKVAITLKVYKCMKCSTHFSQDSEYVSVISMSTLGGSNQLKCPVCGSTLVIETDELSTLNVKNDTETTPEANLNKDQHSENTVKPNLQHSESFSSIGSATSLDESRESTPSTNALNKKYESDIEILSNPSQSSIEVLDEASRTHLTPHRKHSSEERRTAVAPSLLTIPDTAPNMTGLTESSSSGSLTDSICTAYENKIIKQVNVDKKSPSGSYKEPKFTPVTNLTSMLGGLLQSIKIGSNKPLMLKAEESSNFLGSDIRYSYTDFSSIDHRIKLHLILNIFEHENEELVLLLRADILMQNTKDVFPGCLVLSTSKVYVLKIDGIEGEEPQRWLSEEISWTIDRLRSFAPLPFKQGVVIELEQPNKNVNDELHSTITFLCILQDFQRTFNFLYYITDLSLPPSCEVEFTVPEHCTSLMQHLLKNCKNYQDADTTKLFALFPSGSLNQQDLEDQLKLSSLIVTSSMLVICNMQWLLPRNNEMPHVIREQAMSNLLGIEQCGTSLVLNFLDEVAGQEYKWNLNFISLSAAETVIISIQTPWKELFSIPLQVTTGKIDDTENV